MSWLALGAACGLAGCASGSHALEYVVLKNGDGPGAAPPPEELQRQESAARPDKDWPIYDEAPIEMAEGTGGSGCGVGLFGEDCERGLLSDIPSLEEQALLGEDGKVIEAPLRPPGR